MARRHKFLLFIGDFVEIRLYFFANMCILNMQAQLMSLIVLAILCGLFNPHIAAVLCGSTLHTGTSRVFCILLSFGPNCSLNSWGFLHVRFGKRAAVCGERHRFGKQAAVWIETLLW